MRHGFSMATMGKEGGRKTMSYLCPWLQGEERKGSDHNSPSPQPYSPPGMAAQPHSINSFAVDRRYATRGQTRSSQPSSPRERVKPVGKPGDRTYLPHMYGPYSRSAALSHCSTTPDSLLVAVGRRHGSAHTRLLSQSREGRLRQTSLDLSYPTGSSLCLVWPCSLDVTLATIAGELHNKPKIYSDPFANALKELVRQRGCSWLCGSPGSDGRLLGRVLDASVDCMSEHSG